MQNNARELAALAGAASAMILSECASIAANTGQDAQTMAQDVAGMVKRLIGRRTTTAVEATNKRDGRATTYSVRVQLIYGQSLMADSHPELDLNEFGDFEVTGLLGVPDLAHQMAIAFHADHDPRDAVIWPSEEELDRRMKTVRVTMARGQGKGRWPIKYRVGPDEWTAFVLIATPERVAAAQDAAEPAQLRHQN